MDIIIFLFLGLLLVWWEVVDGIFNLGEIKICVLVFCFICMEGRNRTLGPLLGLLVSHISLKRSVLSSKY